MGQTEVVDDLVASGILFGPDESDFDGHGEVFGNGELDVSAHAGEIDVVHAGRDRIVNMRGDVSAHGLSSDGSAGGGDLNVSAHGLDVHAAVGGADLDVAAHGVGVHQIMGPGYANVSAHGFEVGAIGGVIDCDFATHAVDFDFLEGRGVDDGKGYERGNGEHGSQEGETNPEVGHDGVLPEDITAENGKGSGQNSYH